MKAKLENLLLKALGKRVCDFLTPSISKIPFCCLPSILPPNQTEPHLRRPTQMPCVLMPTDSCWPALVSLISADHSATHQSLTRRVFGWVIYHRVHEGKREIWTRKMSVLVENHTSPSSSWPGSPALGCQPCWRRLGCVTAKQGTEHREQLPAAVTTVPHCCHMSPDAEKDGTPWWGVRGLRGSGMSVKYESLACSTKWNGRKMMNDKIIQQMRTGWHVTTNEDQPESGLQDETRGVDWLFCSLVLRPLESQIVALNFGRENKHPFWIEFQLDISPKLVFSNG